MATKASKISLLFILFCYSFIINAVPGTFEPVTGSPFSTNIGPTSVAYSPEVSGNLFAAIVNSAVIGSPSNNLSIYSVNQTNGQLTLAESVPTVVSSQSVAFSPEVAGNLFVAFTRGGTGYNNVTTYLVNTTNGQLTLVGSYPTGNSPNSVTFSPEVAGNLFAAVTNFGSDTVSVYSVSTATGQFTPVAGSPFATANDPSSVAFSPVIAGNLFAAVTSNSNSTVSVYSVNTTTGQFIPEVGSVPVTGLNPNSIAFSPNISGNLFAAVANAGSSTVSVYTVDAINGRFTPVTGSPYATGNTPQSVAFSSDVSGNLFAATSNYGSNTVSVYSVNPVSGQFTPITGSPYATGTNPYSVAFSPYVSNLFAAVTNFSDGTISAYQVLLQPIVTSINPVRGPASGGTIVTIDGMNFTNTSTVSFGGLPATTVTFVSSSQLIATSPARTGIIDVTVTTAGGTSAISTADHFTYIALPTVIRINPTQGPTTGGTSVILTGFNLITTTAVSFGGTPATSFIVNSDTQITATSPARAAGSVNITVTAVGGTSTASADNLFTYIAPPTVTSIAPTQGPIAGATSVILTGTNFTGATAVSFGGTLATSFVVNSNTQITAVSPAEAAGSVNVTVTTVGGTSAATAGNLFTYIAPPTVASITPAQGPITGGTSVVLTGTNLNTATAVSFGGTPATSFVVNSNTQITAVSPAEAAGSVNITVTTAGGTSAAAPGNLFTYIALPTVTSINPTQGPTTGGTSVILTGTNFTGATAVSFGGTPATSFVVNSNTQITAVSPAEAAGSVNITVTTVGGTSTAAPGNLFTYIALPTVTSIAPTQGPTFGGTSVILTGTNFSGATAVSFGGTPATSFIVNSNTQITAISPARVAGSVNITVTTVGGTSVAAPGNLFTYIALPTVTNINPTQGPTTGGTSVILTGTNLSTTTVVSFGGTPATSFVINSNTQITAVSPAKAAGSVNIIVTTVGGTSAAAAGNLFTYIAPPTVTSIAPTQGPTTGGTSVVLTGTNFTGATAVSFGGTPATSFVVNSNTQITAVSPAEVAGSVNITVTTVGGTSTATAGNLFTYIAPPTVTSIAPTQGSTTGGTSVILTGTNLSTTTAVSFGGTPATSFVVNSNTQITAISPARAAGSVNITVTTVGGNSVAAAGNLFTYIAPPTVTIVNPDEGAEDGGTVVTLTGTNLSTTSGVLFGSTPATSFTVISDTQITTISPAGMAGNINIIVTAVGGTSTAAPGNLFSYIPLPSVTGVSPSQGPSNGGTLVTLTGINFNTVTAVQFGSLPATSFTVISDNKITAVSPAGAAGNVNIIVTNIDGASSASPNNIFTYIGLPTLTAVSPSQGPISGGTIVTLTGTSLSTTSGVFFGSIPALSFTVISDTKITAVSPTGVGIVNVTVTNIEGTSASSPANVFAYVSSPLITTITPNQGLTNGGTPVTIIGSNFTSTSGVFFGNTPALSFTVISDSQINAISPAALAGVYNITVITDFGVSSPTAVSQFTYVLPLLPPKNAKVHQVSRRFATQTDLINVITWQPPSSGVAPVSYKIFRDPELTQLVAVINADRTHFRFNDHNRKKDQRYDYYLVSVDGKNQQSAAIHLKVGKTK